MTYEYEDLVEKGFIKVNVGRSLHNKMFPKRKQKFGSLIEYYYNPDKNIVEIQYFLHWWYKALLIIFLFLPSIFIQGIPETIKDTGNLVYERKRGKFVADRWWLNEDKPVDERLTSLLDKAVKDKGEKK